MERVRTNGERNEQPTAFTVFKVVLKTEILLQKTLLDKFCKSHVITHICDNEALEYNMRTATQERAKKTMKKYEKWELKNSR